MKLRTLPLLLAPFLSFAFAAGEIVITYKDDVSTLDPAIGYDWQNWSMIKSLFDGLMETLARAFMAANRSTSSLIASVGAGVVLAKKNRPLPPLPPPVAFGVDAGTAGSWVVVAPLRRRAQSDSDWLFPPGDANMLPSGDSFWVIVH